MEQNNTEQIDKFFDSPFENRVLWQYSPKKSRMFIDLMKYIITVLGAFLLIGIILALTGVMFWTGLILFGGIAALTCVVACLALLFQKKTIYTITETEIIIDYPSMTCDSVFENIKKIKKSRSLFNKNVGTIKFKLKKGISFNYRFSQIDDIDSVYDLLISLLEKHKQA